jgi:hypothetical protein
MTITSEVLMMQSFIRWCLEPFIHWISVLIMILFFNGDGHETLCARAFELHLQNKDNKWTVWLTKVMNWYEDEHTLKAWLTYQRSKRYEPPRDE